MTNIVQNWTTNGRGIDGLLGIRPRDRWMVDADESTKPLPDYYVNYNKC